MMNALQTITFVGVTAVWAVLCRRQLANPGCHGFYRFFAVVGVCFLAVQNIPYWTANPGSATQSLSWLLLLVSLYLLVHGLILLRRRGGHLIRKNAHENFNFENTEKLVTTGIYRYIRHPMYASLLFLAWGIYFKSINAEGSVTVALTSLFLILTARTEERENIAFFGQQYRAYQQRSKMFIPFVL